MQGAAAERIDNLRTVENHKAKLKELEGKANEFKKYEIVICSKFECLEKSMSEMDDIRSKYMNKEKEFKKGKI